MCACSTLSRILSNQIRSFKLLKYYHLWKSLLYFRWCCRPDNVYCSSYQMSHVSRKRRDPNASDSEQIPNHVGILIYEFHGRRIRDLCWMDCYTGKECQSLGSSKYRLFIWSRNLMSDAVCEGLSRCDGLYPWSHLQCWDVVLQPQQYARTPTDFELATHIYHNFCISREPGSYTTCVQINPFRSEHFPGGQTTNQRPQVPQKCLPRFYSQPESQVTISYICLISHISLRDLMFVCTQNTQNNAVTP